MPRPAWFICRKWLHRNGANDRSGPNGCNCGIFGHAATRLDQPNFEDQKIATIDSRIDHGFRRKFREPSLG